MRKVWVVAVREYRTNVKSKPFLIVMAVMPVLMFGSIGIPRFMRDRVDTDTKRIAVVDRSGKLFATLADAAALRNENQIFDEAGGRQIRPRYELEAVPVADGDPSRQLLALSDRVRAKSLFAFIEIAPDALDADPGTAKGAVRYYSNQPTYRDVRRWLSGIITGRVQTVRLGEAGIDREVVARAMQPVKVETLGLVSQDAEGKIQEAEEVDQAVAFIVPFAVMMLMWMALVITVQPMLNGVLEEKMQRIAEVLLGSVTPFKLMLGKLVGYVMVAVTLMAVYMVGGYFVAHHFGYTDRIAVGLVVWFMVFLTLAILMYGSLFLGVGACCNDLSEAQHLILPLWIPMIVPMLFMPIIIEHPDSTAATVLSLFPLTAPMTTVVRMAIPPGVPAWQPPLAALSTLLATLACVWIGGRIFRVGLLLQGTPPRFTEMIRWAVRG